MESILSHRSSPHILNPETLLQSRFMQSIQTQWELANPPEQSSSKVITMVLTKTAQSQF